MTFVLCDLADLTNCTGDVCCDPFTMCSCTLGVVTEVEGRIASTLKEQDFDAASEILSRMKYYQTILDSIDDKLHAKYDKSE